MTTLASEAPERLAVLDADSHLTDVNDLWTKRAPAKYKDEILHVGDDRRPAHLGRRGVGRRQGRRRQHHRQGGREAPVPRVDGRVGLREGPRGRVGHRRPAGDPRRHGHPAPGALPQRPRTGGPGPGRGQGPGAAATSASRSSTTPGPRSRAGPTTGCCPMPILPAWDIDACVREAERVSELGLRGREHDLGPPGPRFTGPGQPGVGPALGGLRRP